MVIKEQQLYPLMERKIKNRKMKKFLMCLLAIVFVSIGVYAQVDSTAISTLTTSVVTLLLDSLGKFISNNIWTVIFFVCFILSEILASVKFTPKNSICQVLWYSFKAIIRFIAFKKV